MRRVRWPRLRHSEELLVPNVYEPRLQEQAPGVRRARVGEEAASEHLGLSVFELAPGAETDRHYHVANEELLIVLSGKPSLRAGDRWRRLTEGEVVSFPRGDAPAARPLGLSTPAPRAASRAGW